MDSALSSLSSDEREASTLTTPPERLAELASGECVEVRRAVASNPSTPAAVLAGLIASFPSEVLGNPSLALHVLANPYWFRQLPLDLRLAWAEEQPLSLALAGLLIGYGPELSVLRELLQRPDLPEEILLRMASEAPPVIRLMAVDHPRCSRTLLQQLSEDVDDEVLAGVVRHPLCSLELLKEMAHSPLENVRAVTATRLDELLDEPRLRETLVGWMASEGPAESRVVVASLRRCPTPLLERLARDPSEEVREAVARRRRCPAALRRQLADDPSPRVRAAAVVRPARPA